MNLIAFSQGLKLLF